MDAIIDNRERRLVQQVGDALDEGAVSVRLAVGYLFLDGLVPLCDALNRLETVEILIGNVVNRLTVEQVREEAAASRHGGAGMPDQEDMAATPRDTHDLAAVETALNLRETVAGLERTPEMRALLLLLAGKVARGDLKIRLYTQGRINAKLTLIGFPESHLSAPGLAVVGSSNLTLGGPAHPTEMNVSLADPDAFHALERWFKQLWEASQDFHREFFAELGRSWAMG